MNGSSKPLKPDLHSIRRPVTLWETTPRVIAWEITRKCPLHCRHCRGVAESKVYEDELCTDECLRLIDAIVSFSTPLLIMTGGEPMSRPDVFQLARYATDAGLPVVLAPCGGLINEQTIYNIKQAGIQAISISLDGKDADTHDHFRGVPGAYDTALQALGYAKAAGLPFQVNTTVTRHNVDELPAILEKVIALGAMTLDFFFLVPTGRGRGLVDEQLSPALHEQTLNWIYDRVQEQRIPIRITCGPQYARIARQRSQEHKPATITSHASTGCMAGHGFIFISHLGIVQPCGFLDLACGDLRGNNFDLQKIYETSSALTALRKNSGYHEPCSACEYWNVCGGCRARAYEKGGDYLGSDPQCTYAPTNCSTQHE